MPLFVEEIKQEIIDYEFKKIERIEVKKVLTFYQVKCSKCGKILGIYADKEIAEYLAKHWLKCCDC